MTLLSIGDRVEPGIYRLHSRFKRAVNYVHRGCLVSVVDETIGPGPLNIVMRALPAGARLCECQASMPAEGLRLEVRPRTVLFAGHRYPFTSRQRYNSALDLPTVDLHRFRSNLSAFGKLLRDSAPAQSLTFLLDETRLRHFRTRFERAFTRQIRGGVHHLFQGKLLKGVGELKGCGLGLTPSGDDFIAGLLIGLHLLQKLHHPELESMANAVCRAAQGSNLFSNTALDLARQGRLFGRLKEVLVTLVSGNARPLRRVARGLLAVGATSGADLATGFFMTVSAQGGVIGRRRAQTAPRNVRYAAMGGPRCSFGQPRPRAVGRSIGR